MAIRRNTPKNSFGGGFKGFNSPRRMPSFSAAGNYPSDRRYGTTVNRSVIESWDLNSDWVKWRKGYEFYLQAAWRDLVVTNPDYPAESDEQFVRGELQSTLYQGTAFEVDVVFTGLEFSTKNADGNTHYVGRRKIETPHNIGTATAVIYDEWQQAHEEVWVAFDPGTKADILPRSLGDRITDGTTEATLQMVLTDENRPAVYEGKTLTTTEEFGPARLEPTIITVSFAATDIERGVDIPEPIDVVTHGGLGRRTIQPRNSDLPIEPESLIGKIIYIPAYYVEENIDDVDFFLFADGPQFFGAAIFDVRAGAEMIVLDPGQEDLPPSLYDISDLEPVFSVPNCVTSISGVYAFPKNVSQKYWDPQSLDPWLIAPTVETLAYALLPFTVAKASYDATSRRYELESVPFSSELQLFADLKKGAKAVFTDWSFIEYGTDDTTGMKTINTDVLPGQDEIFTSGDPLQLADLYTCSCPNYSQAILSVPRATQDEGTRKTNRQRRYPLPGVMSLDAWQQSIGVEQTAGRMSNWSNRRTTWGFKMCKHTIASYFIDNIKVIEPSQYPSVESRIQFEEKLRKEVEEMAETFLESYRRSLISLDEIIFAIAQGLNLDNIELGYVMLQQ